MSVTSSTTRPDGRTADELRPVTHHPQLAEARRGLGARSSSATRRCCAPPRSTQGVPRWRKGSGLGWVTAEYAMLPRATLTRNDRESVRGKIGGRTHEISRLIGRSLRAAIDLSALGENSIAIDCDVLQADGGTRTAAITGAYVALADAVSWLRGEGRAGQARAAHQLDLRGLGRRHRRRAAAGPDVRRGRARGDRHERRLHRRRRLRRGAGHGRGRAVPTATSSTRCSTSPSAGCRRAAPSIQAQPRSRS